MSGAGSLEEPLQNKNILPCQHVGFCSLKFFLIHAEKTQFSLFYVYIRYRYRYKINLYYKMR